MIIFLSASHFRQHQHLIQSMVVLNSNMPIPVSWRILFEKLYKFLQFLLLFIGKVAVHKNNAQIGKPPTPLLYS
ncbi:MAG: hypothetical protein ACLSWM_07195 [Barnesiella sp.]|nr:hypothetical protein [Barnesiella sp. GGCC_0306]MBS7040482.1 hypothetical protein [Bacteroidales bacterium]